MAKNEIVRGANATLDSWRDTPTKEAIVAFVEKVTSPGPTFVPPEARVAVFDNDGTLWCEKPLPVQADFVLRRLAAAADDDPALRAREPWRAAHARDFAWFEHVIVRHYAGDDRELKTMVAGILASYDGAEVEALGREARAFLESAVNPVLERPYLKCGFAPMKDLLAYLRSHGFVTCIASGGGRDFIRVVSRELYGVGPEQVIGSTSGLHYVDTHGGALVHGKEPGILDDGAEKPVSIWNRLGRRPILVGGNADGDLPMMRFARCPDGGEPLRLLVVHDDDEREFSYVEGAEKVLEAARREAWTMASVRRDWSLVFRDA